MESERKNDVELEKMNRKADQRESWEAVSDWETAIVRQRRKDGNKENNRKDNELFLFPYRTYTAKILLQN